MLVAWFPSLEEHGSGLAEPKLFAIDKIELECGKKSGGGGGGGDGTCQHHFYYTST